MRRVFLSGGGGLPFAGGARVLTPFGSALALWCR
jgi:hypothetical protein